MALVARAWLNERLAGSESNVATSGIEKPERESIKDAILIAGPTASGKSRMALDLAARLGGTIVNTDSMQVYSVLKILTARPGREDTNRVPHLLYGHVHPSVAYSAGAWVRDVADLTAAGRFVGTRPIFVGGTGLYFRALEEGISRMPTIPNDVRERWRAMLAERGPQELHSILSRMDARAAGILKPGDSQRIARALEVIDASGRSILDWQADRGKPLIDRHSARFVVIEPDRAELAARIDRRLEGMVDEGALDEVKALDALDLDPALPATKAIGFREFRAALTGDITTEQALDRAKITTRQYSRRQSTWFRNQLGSHWLRVERAADLRL
ncbi:MAG: tRNA (adenosine(37)-N6)-dimethylallyltransferase MiaA [Rhizobiaceae bacterium]|nr:tRNA (adenosine(37)-N6)-dimethylallyltransferase MiaA [Rhizobiaceae bacterium]